MAEAKGKYSALYKCGYSPDQTGGVGNLNGGAPFTTCDYTRTSCMARGMFRRDSASMQRAVRRNGVRSAADSGAELWREGNAAFAGARQPGALQRFRAAGLRDGVVSAADRVRAQRRESDADGSAAGDGRDQGVLKVMVNEIEIPEGAERRRT